MKILSIFLALFIFSVNLFASEYVLHDAYSSRTLTLITDQKQIQYKLCESSGCRFLGPQQSYFLTAIDQKIKDMQLDTYLYKDQVIDREGRIVTYVAGGVGFLALIATRFNPVLAATATGSTAFLVKGGLLLRRLKSSAYARYNNELAEVSSATDLDQLLLQSRVDSTKYYGFQSEVQNLEALLTALSQH